MPEWQFENTKDTPLGQPSEGAHSRFKRMEYEFEDAYEYWPCFLGAKQISRYVSFIDAYKQTLGIAGHMAEVGVYRGGISLLLAKLSLLYEPHALTQVHGFDMFERIKAAATEVKGHTFTETYQRVKDLIEVQGLQRWVLLHQMDVRTELKPFFDTNTHLRFKLVFLDAGSYETVRTCIEQFWPRLMPGGIMIFDQFNHEVAPGETKAVTEALPTGTVVRTFPAGWMPTAYVVKT